MGEIILIGTSHTDPRGKQRLERLLNHLKPDILTLEASKGKLEFVLDADKEVRSILTQKGIKQELTEELIYKVMSYYEIGICEKYAKKHKTPLYWIDTEGISSQTKEENKEAMEIIKNTDLTNDTVTARLKKMDALGRDKIALERTDFLTYGNLKLYRLHSLGKVEDLLERDLYMADKIKAIAAEHADKRITHVGGALHVVRDSICDYPTLAMLLPESESYFLNEADFFDLQNKIKPYLDKTS